MWNHEKWLEAHGAFDATDCVAQNDRRLTGHVEHLEECRCHNDSGGGVFRVGFVSFGHEISWGNFVLVIVIIKIPVERRTNKMTISGGRYE